MASTASRAVDEVLIGRRQNSRHPIDLSARIVAHGFSLRVQLEDLSATGACIRLMHPRRITGARLRWLHYEWPCVVVWQSGLRCGLAFEEALAPECLKQTLAFGEQASGITGDRFKRLASAWVFGPGDY
jgi:hypothetical protein